MTTEPPGPTANKNEPMVDRTSEWLKVDGFRDVSIPDDYRRVSMFNRSVYTIDDDGIISPKYSKVNLLIKTIDDLTLYDSFSCGRRIGPNTYVGLMPIAKNIGCSTSGGKVCVLGIISEEFLKNNNLLDLDSPIQDLSEFDVMSLKEAEIEINDPQTHTHAFERRLGTTFVKKLALFREMDQFK